MEFIDLKAQYQLLEEKIDQRIKKVLKHGRYIMGPEVFELEEKLAEYCGVKHAITVANGTDALQLSLMALGIGPGDAVITTTFSFFASAEVISLVGAIPIFVDIEEDTFNICPEKLEQTILKYSDSADFKVKAVIAVDLFGLPADYTKIEPLCKEHGLFLIEDAAQSFGASIKDRKACSFGDIATTSFFPAKPLGCYGDGGAVFTGSDELAEMVKSLRVHGMGKDKYDNVRIGMNSRLDTIQAAVLLEKIKNVENEIECRNKNAKNYNSRLNKCFHVPFSPEGFMSAIAQYTVKVEAERRQEVLGNLGGQDIPAQIYYNKPIHLLDAFSSLQLVKGLYPVAEKLSNEVFSIPVHAYLEADQQERVIEALLGVQ